MLEHSKILEETALWQIYKERIPESSERIKWIKEVYQAASTYLKDVRIVFKNYTLHDEVHILNVLDAMGGLLGDHIKKLTIGEIELLILAASLHDLGMVYTDAEKRMYLENEKFCKEFLMEHHPDLLGTASKEWKEDIQQWYLRTLHPFRITDVFQKDAWTEMIEHCPKEIISTDCIIAVCQAHGEKPEDIRVNQNLEYRKIDDVDPLFCAILLRLADLLDFDDTRAPKILYSYVKCNDKSRKEWDKHQASAGFCYPVSPCTDKLSYKARCKKPGIEHTIRDFLDWIDDELYNAFILKKNCEKEWQKEFPFPQAIERKGIESDGYMSGDFCLTMDQEQSLNLLMGEKLYTDRNVFVRELLQNAIDATLLRGKLDKSFIPEKSHINFWEWTDCEGNLWFRIDDEGTGMTQGMLQRYFLKVGNSYYTSSELIRDLRTCGQTEEYQGISEFGIGFLSCFLCGDYVEVSTLYYDQNKNHREESMSGTSIITSYGLHLQVTGLTGYFSLKNQAKNHKADNLPISQYFDNNQNMIERNGYRINPGTSIVVRLNSEKLGVVDLRNTVEKYLCGAKIPVYYNNKRIGRTYKEAMKIVRENAGRKIYELTPELKKRFDDCFPAIKGKYPKLESDVISLDIKVDSALSGVLIKYKLQFDQSMQWKKDDQIYDVVGYIDCDLGVPEIHLISRNITNERGIFPGNKQIEWSDLEKIYGNKKTKDLETKLKFISSCPDTGEQLGKVWVPFSGNIDISTVWVAYHDYCNKKNMTFEVNECEVPNICTIFNNNWITKITYAYKGISVDFDDNGFSIYDNCSTVFFWLDGKNKPDMKIGRSEVSSLPLETLLEISTIANIYGISKDVKNNITRLRSRESISLQKYQEIRKTSLGKWIDQKQKEYFESVKQALQEKRKIRKNGEYMLCSLFNYTDYPIINEYLKAYFQKNYTMSIDYEKDQIIEFIKKEHDEYEESYNIFPPMLFCKAATVQSKKYICHAESEYRRGFTKEHPFIVWLLENAVHLSKYFKRQFKQITDCLCKRDADEIIEEWEKIREQLISLSNQYGIDIYSSPKLGLNDFWSEEK